VVEGERPVFLSPDEFAQRTGLSVATVRDIVREHRLAATNTAPGKARRLLILASEVDRLAAEA
jgi:excisionase family DNA binding protein